MCPEFHKLNQDLMLSIATHVGSFYFYFFLGIEAEYPISCFPFYLTHLMGLGPMRASPDLYF